LIEMLKTMGRLQAALIALQPKKCYLTVQPGPLENEFVLNIHSAGTAGDSATTTEFGTLTFGKDKLYFADWVVDEQHHRALPEHSHKNAHVADKSFDFTLALIVVSILHSVDCYKMREKEEQPQVITGGSLSVG
jgi:hypothetical protein